jgi:hypothetical protein
LRPRWALRLEDAGLKLQATSWRECVGGRGACLGDAVERVHRRERGRACLGDADEEAVVGLLIDQRVRLLPRPHPVPVHPLPRRKVGWLSGDTWLKKLTE